MSHSLQKEVAFCLSLFFLRRTRAVSSDHLQTNRGAQSIISITQRPQQLAEETCKREKATLKMISKAKGFTFPAIRAA
jgi:hypothetical protein